MNPRRLARRVAAVCIGLAACGQQAEPATQQPAEAAQPPQPTEPAAEATEPTPNDADSLRSAASRLQRIEIADEDSHEILFAATPEVVAAVRESLIANTEDPGTPMGSPQWPVAVLLHVEGRDEPFIAFPIGPVSLRLNSKEPWSAMIANEQGEVDGRSTAVDVDDALFEAIGGAMGPSAEHKEYSRPPR